MNLIEIEKDDGVRAFVPVKTLDDEKYTRNHNIIMATEKGIVKKTSLEAYSRPRRNGILAISVDDDDNLLSASLTDGKSTILLGAKNGRAIRFKETDVRLMGRNTRGVRGINLSEKQDQVVDMVVIKNTNDATVLALSEQGYGKRSLVEDYRQQTRGGKGVITLKITPKTGKLIALKEVSDNDDLMIITEKGKIIRMHSKDIRSMGRNTQGVRMMRLGSEDRISGITRVVSEEDTETVKKVGDNGEEVDLTKNGNGPGSNQGNVKPEDGPEDKTNDGSGQSSGQLGFDEDL